MVWVSGGRIERRVPLLLFAFIQVLFLGAENQFYTSLPLGTTILDLLLQISLLLKQDQPHRNHFNKAKAIQRAHSNIATR